MCATALALLARMERLLEQHAQLGRQRAGGEGRQTCEAHSPYFATLAGNGWPVHVQARRRSPEAVLE